MSTLSNDIYIKKVNPDYMSNSYIRQSDNTVTGDAPYIDTGIKLHANMSIEVKASASANTGMTSGFMVGAYATFSSGGTCHIGAGLGKVFVTSGDVNVVHPMVFQYGHTHGYSNDIVPLNEPKIYKLEIDNSLQARTMYCGEYVSTSYSTYSNSSAADLTRIGNFFLFAPNSNGSVFDALKFRGDIYYCKFWDGNTLTKHFIPAYHNGEYCFYEQISGTYYMNEGTGAFEGYIQEPEETLYHFQNDSIFDSNAETTVALVGEELCIDTFTATVKDEFENIHNITLFRPSDQLLTNAYEYDGILSRDLRVLSNYVPASSGLIALNYASPVYWYNDQVLKGKYYLKSVERTAENRYKINAMSAVGLLDKQYHVGGIYTGATLKTVVDEIIGDLKDSILTYTFEPEVESRTVYGWLPYDTKRNNLYQVLFATNTNLIKASNGQIIFTKLINTSSLQIEDARIFDSGTVEYDAEASEVRVAEHIIKGIGTETEETLFDNSSGTSVTNQLIKFDNAPIQVSTIRSDTLTIVESGVNYAIVTGQGVLYGKPYTHTTNILRKINADASEENVVSCDNATLVTSMNGTSVLERLYKYYVTSKRVRVGIVLNNERCGNKYSFRDAFNDVSSGFLEKMSVTITSFAKAQCEFVADYNPYTSSGYSHQVLLSNSQGTWTVPSGISQIRVTMISGGKGGSSGKAGDNGTIGSPTTYEGDLGYLAGNGGSGGESGEPGTGGRIHTEILSVSAGDVFQYACGIGGTGGVQSSSHSTFNQGTLGTDTTFGSYSTENYTSLNSGFLDVFTGTIYGLTAIDDGANGGSGGNGGTYPDLESIATAREKNGKDGGSVTFNGALYSGGKGASRTRFTIPSIYGNLNLMSCGGGGGGTVAGKTGNDGAYAYSNFGTDANNPVYTTEEKEGIESAGMIIAQDLTLQGTTWDGQKTWRNFIVNHSPLGANGMSADPRPNTYVYGQGGLPGHGGGGGGGNGAYHNWTQDWSYTHGAYVEQCVFLESPINPAQGGYGGAGGKGGDGCIIIYY